MSEEKAKCEKCGKETSAKVEEYSREHYDGHVYCYSCQKEISSEGSSVGSWRYDEKAKKKGTLGEFGDTAKQASPASAAEEEQELGEFAKQIDEEPEPEPEPELELEPEEGKLGSESATAELKQTIASMSTVDKNNFDKWLKSEYGVENVEDLSLGDRRAVLDEIKKYAKIKKGVLEEAVEPEVVGMEAEEGKREEEEHWDKSVEIDEGTFMFREEGGKLLCKNAANGSVYALDVGKPECECEDFRINKRGNEWCKHLKAAAATGEYPVKELPKVPAEVEKALAKPEKQKRSKAKKEEVVAITVLDKQVEMPVQTPTEMITSEEKAVEMIKGIIGSNPKKEDVIESYAGIEELNADVVLSLASYLGIPYRIVEKEIEKTRISIGEIYKLGASQDQIAKYGKIAEIMPEVDVVTRCKVTVAAAWKDKSGNTRLSVGVKEEILTPHDLADIARRGASFIETKAITKAAKKALLSVLPVTHDGLRSKIRKIYNWE